MSTSSSRGNCRDRYVLHVRENISKRISIANMRTFEEQAKRRLGRELPRLMVVSWCRGRYRTGTILPWRTSHISLPSAGMSPIVANSRICVPAELQMSLERHVLSDRIGSYLRRSDNSAGPTLFTGSSSLYRRCPCPVKKEASSSPGVHPPYHLVRCAAQMWLGNCSGDHFLVLLRANRPSKGWQHKRKSRGA